MPSKNVDTVRAMFDSFNRRNLDATVGVVSDNFTFDDRARGITFTGQDGYMDFLRGWTAAFSDGQATNVRCIDAGDTVVVEFMGQGTNDGPLGPLPGTGKKVDLPFCEIVKLNDRGQIVSIVGYYDQLTMLMQLGHAPAAV